jgi:hypothetical protein
MRSGEIGVHLGGVRIETLHDPGRYTHAQLERARALAASLNRGRLVLVEAPRR